VHPALGPGQAGQKSILVIQLLSFEGTWGDQNLNPTAKLEKLQRLRLPTSRNQCKRPQDDIICTFLTGLQPKESVRNHLPAQAWDAVSHYI